VVLKLEQKVESRTKNHVVVTWSLCFAENGTPSVAVVNINLFNGNVMQHFRKKNRQKQIILERFLSKEKSSGGDVNEL
jgi:hypothetical protein